MSPSHINVALSSSLSKITKVSKYINKINEEWSGQHAMCVPRRIRYLLAGSEGEESMEAHICSGGSRMKRSCGLGEGKAL